MNDAWAPPWALTADAIDGTGDTHLQPRFHVRLLPSARLGLPAAPLLVYRTVLPHSLLEGLWNREGAIWVDSRGQRVVPPFDVVADNPVFGHFPRRDVVAARLSASGACRFEAVSSSDLGPVTLQAAPASVLTLACHPLPMVRVTGTGTVLGLSWLAVHTALTTAGATQIGQWSLPVDAATPRYRPLPDAVARAVSRVRQAATMRQPMHVAFTAASPADAPPVSSADAERRLAQARPQVDRWLQALLTDTRQPTWELADTSGMNGGRGMQFAIEPIVLAAAVEPDMARYLGFSDIDTSELPVGAEDGLRLYQIRGIWRWRPQRWLGAEAKSLLPSVCSDAAAVGETFPDLAALNVLPTETGSFVDLTVAAVVMAGVVPAPLPPVTFRAPDDRGFLATPPPPDARRAIGLVALGFRPHAVAALAASDGLGPRSLHPYPGQGRQAFGGQPPAGLLPLSLVVSRAAAVPEPGSGSFEDRDAPAGLITYRLAQGDWFGRWSEWALVTVPPKLRTPPLRPSLELSVRAPDTAAADDGPASYAIELRIPLPRADDLPAGGFVLQRLELDESFDGAAMQTVNVALPGETESHPAPEHDLLVVRRSGPPMLRSASARIRYTARWIDAAGGVSADAFPAARTLVDPRPARAPVVETRLRWTARPDAGGHARVDLDFESLPGARYRVFTSNESTLLRALDKAGEAAGGGPARAAAADIRAAAPGAPRAERFRAHRQLFDWPHFESLSDAAVIATGTSTHVVHRVSGSLELLVFYRVLGEGVSGALSPMAQAELVPFRVPNHPPPARPQLDIVSDPASDPVSLGVRLRVSVPRGLAVPKAWRLRRSSAPVRDALRMQTVAEGAVTDTEEDMNSTRFSIVAAAPLDAWRRYGFSVQVQSADPPGAPSVGAVLPGAWSEASAIVTLAVVPKAAPLPATSVSAVNDNGALAVALRHPNADALGSTSQGPFGFELWRCQPGERPRPVDARFVRGAGDTWLARDPGVAPAGTYVSVRIVDPAGRRSDAVLSTPL